MNVSNNNLTKNMSNRMKSPIGAQLISHFLYSSNNNDLHNFHILNQLVESKKISADFAVKIMMGKETYTGISFSKEFVKLSKKVLKTELYNMRRESEEKTVAKFQYLVKVLQNSENKALRAINNTAAKHKLFNMSGSGQLKVNESQNLSPNLQKELDTTESEIINLQKELDQANLERVQLQQLIKGVEEIENKNTEKFNNKITELEQTLATAQSKNKQLIQKIKGARETSETLNKNLDTANSEKDKESNNKITELDNEIRKLEEDLSVEKLKDKELRKNLESEKSTMKDLNEKLDKEGLEQSKLRQLLEENKDLEDKIYRISERI